jgi:SAM-dependent methyltransferase
MSNILSAAAAGMVAAASIAATGQPPTTQPASPSLQAPPHGYTPAEPLRLEKGSYAASQRDHYNRVYAAIPPEQSIPNPFLLQCLALIDAEADYQRALAAEKVQREARAGASVGAAPIETRADDAPLNNQPPPSRTALDAGMGDGRNTIALARHGFAATGFDFSDVGVNRARWRAAELGLAIDARVSLSDDSYWEAERWDIVALMYFTSTGLERAKQSIKPGGHLIIEYAGEDAGNRTLRELLDWQIIIYETALGERQWESKQPVRGQGLRTRVLARKPMPE